MGCNTFFFHMCTLNKNIVCEDIYLNSNICAIEHTKNNLSCLTINVRSLRFKFPNLLIYLSLLCIRFSFIILTEVWLDKDLARGFNIEGYNFLPCYRNENGGGILLYYKKGISVVEISQQTGLFDTHEALLIKAHVSSLGDLFLWAFYRPPDRSLRSFIAYLENELPKFSDRRLILCGDFNYDINSIDNSGIIKDICNVFESFGLMACINKPTYFSGSNKSLTSCLDHYWQNFSQYKASSFVIHPPFSDHLGIGLLINFSTTGNALEIVRFRNFCFENKRKFSRSIKNLCNSFQLLSNDINVEIARFITWMKHTTDKYFPLKSKHISDKRLRAPWLTRTIMKCIRKKHTWYKMFMAGLITYGSYRDYCRLVQRLIRAAERSYFEAKFKNMGNDSSKNWKIINNLISFKNNSRNSEFNIDGSMTSDKTIIAHKFHSFFETVPLNIGAALPPSAIDGLEHMDRCLNSFYFSYSTPNEIFSIVKSLKNNKNEDGLLMKLLKLGNIHISSLISKLINLAISTGTYPDALKFAKITPIFKSGSRFVIENYRPISVLCNLNKIFEKYIYLKLSSYFTRFSLFSDSQFGFRSGFSTESAMFSLVSAVLPAYEDQIYALGVFLDFSKAFDTVNHRILLAKLDRYGIRGMSLSFIESYLANRKQCVNYLGTLSEFRDITIGVPQGSCLGPLFYSIYVNDFQTFLAYKNYDDAIDILYADDTTLILKSHDTQYIQTRCQSLLNSIWDWCLFNRLSLNASKSTAVVFSNRLFPPISLHINNSNITFSNSVKYLGVIFESDLKFTAHIDKLYSSTCKYNGLSYRLSGYFSLSSARSFYFAFFHASITYCIAIWGGMLLVTSAGKKLLNLQKRIIINLFSKFSPGLSYEALLKKYNLLKIEDVYRVKVACLMYSVLDDNEQHFLTNHLRLCRATHSYPTSSRDLYIEPFPRVDCIRINYKYQFIKIWNSIPNYIKRNNSVSKFKKSLTAHILSLY